MFRNAVDQARHFTRPVVISSRNTEGECQAAIGACIVLNREGWVLTAAHLLQLIMQQSQSAQRQAAYQKDLRAMARDRSSGRRHRSDKIHNFQRPHSGAVQNHSVWWGADGAQLADAKIMPAADLALGRLQPFAPESVQRYPVFKSAGPDYLPGRSLCKLGFPFHEIKPQFDEANNAFVLPPGSLPLPLFPLDGIFTRIIIGPPPGGADNMQGKFIETSTPGLRGQSGGPIFAADGAVWALQSHTRHYPLGFVPKTPEKGGREEHQFLNVGVGVHAEPIRQFLQQHGVAHERIA